MSFRGVKGGALADLVDGSIGEASMFHESFGFDAQGVTIDTAVLAEGWEKRLVGYETPTTEARWLFLLASGKGRPGSQ